jgi:hypothetical protein
LRLTFRALREPAEKSFFYVSYFNEVGKGGHFACSVA